MKPGNAKSVMVIVLGLSIAGLTPSATQAQSRSSRPNVATVADEQKRTGITTFYYGHKSNAVGKLNAEQKRGKYARMYYDNVRREWAVDVSNDLNNGGNNRTTVTASGAQTVADEQKRTGITTLLLRTQIQRGREAQRGTKARQICTHVLQRRAP